MKDLVGLTLTLQMAKTCVECLPVLRSPLQGGWAMLRSQCTKSLTARMMTARRTGPLFLICQRCSVLRWVEKEWPKMESV